MINPPSLYQKPVCLSLSLSLVPSSSPQTQLSFLCVFWQEWPNLEVVGQTFREEEANLAQLLSRSGQANVSALDMTLLCFVLFNGDGKEYVRLNPTSVPLVVCRHILSSGQFRHNAPETTECVWYTATSATSCTLKSYENRRHSTNTKTSTTQQERTEEMTVSCVS